MQAYTVGQASEMVGVPPGTIRQWEKSLEGVLIIPRDEKGSRYYTQFEIDALNRVKALRDKGVSFEVIRDILHQSEPGSETTAIATTVPTMSQSEAIKALTDLRAAVMSLGEDMERIVQERVRTEVSERMDKLEDRLGERDKKLTEALRALHEQAAERQQEKEKPRGLFGWFRGK